MAQVSRWSNVIILKLISIFPQILISISCLGMIVTFFFMSRPDLTIKSLLLTVPVGLSGIYVLLRKKKSSVSQNFVFLKKIYFKNLVLLYILLFNLSILLLLISETRTFFYFVVISSLSGVIFLQILYGNNPTNRMVIFLEIVFLSLNLTWGVTLKYGLYYGWTDTLVHLNLINIILGTGYIPGLDISYEYFPIYHILISTSSELTGMAPKYSLFITMGIIWQFGLLFSYIFFKKLSNSGNFALLACLLFAFCSQYIFYGQYPITRSLAFISLLFLSVLFTSWRSRTKFIFSALIILTCTTIILTHHATTLFAIPLIVMIYLLRRITLEDGKGGLLNLTFIALFSVSFISYIFWVSYTFTKSEIPIWLGNIISTEGSSKSVTIVEIGRVFSFTNIYYSLVLFLSLVGIGYIFLLRNEEYKKLKILYIGLACSIFLFLYVPGPLELIPQARSALFWRIPLIVSPFIAFSMAWGIHSLLCDNGLKSKYVYLKSYIAIFITFIIILTTFFSIISGSNAQDSPEMRSAIDDSGYFSYLDLASFSFTSEYINKSESVYSDYAAVRNQYYFNDINSTIMITNGNISYIKNGYVIIRIGELERSNCLIFSASSDGSVRYVYTINPQDPESNIILQAQKYQLIYADHDVRLYSIVGNS